MLDFGELLRQKYAILQQQANTQAEGTRAAAALDLARAGVIPAESKAGIGLTQAQTTNTNRQTDLIGEQVKYYGQNILSEIGLRAANAEQARSGAAVNYANVPILNAEAKIREEAATRLPLGAAVTGARIQGGAPARRAIPLPSELNGTESRGRIGARYNPYAAP